MKLKLHFIISSLIFVIFYHSMSYALTRYAPGGNSAGFRIQLNSDNSVLATQPTIGSDSNSYYLIAPVNQTGIIVNQQSANAYGTVNCPSNYLLGYYYYGLDESQAYHRVFGYAPNTGFKINGLTAYRINANTVYTLYSNNGITSDWKKFSGTTCSTLYFSSPQPATNFTAQFPFEIRVYVKDIPIDGKIIIPGMLLAGYTRLFQDDGAPNISYVPPELSTVKLDLEPSVINYPSSCKSNINNLNINFKTLDSVNFDSKLTHTVNYQCDRSQLTKVKLSLDYVTDSDPQKRVPLKSGNDTIYAELNLFDADINKRGKQIETTINKVKNIQIESHLSGENKNPGQYSGSAWLIATFI
ncbi:adhesin [Morganella psychrotolerans]|uniref:adhesin n=1 Tax=Morganella psychrotolerans TaxID=368603 RepID=UPI0039B08D2C